MNVFFVSQEDFEYGGRTRELLKIAYEIGKTCAVTRGKKENRIFKDHFTVEKKTYASFVIESVKIAIRNRKRIDVLFVAHRKAVIPSLIVRKIFRPKYILYDMPELYLLRDNRSIISKIGCLIEKMIIKRADVVIHANKERADYVENHFVTSAKMIVYENVRKLQYSENVDMEELKNKFDKFFVSDSFKLISTDGYCLDRKQEDLLNDLSIIEENIELYIAGGGKEKDKKKIVTIISRSRCKDKVHFLGLLNQDELKYVISKCDCGIVKYGKEDINNTFCASGKIYEFLFEGIPVACSSNPPLQRICDEEGVGKSGNSFSDSILYVKNNMEEIKKNIESFVVNNNVEKNNARLIEKIRDVLK